MQTGRLFALQAWAAETMQTGHLGDGELSKVSIMNDMSMMKRIYEMIMEDPELAETYEHTRGMRKQDAIVVYDSLISIAYARLRDRETF